MHAAMDLAGVASTKALAEQINQAGMSKGTLDRIARDGREIKAHEAEWIGEATGLPATFFLADDPVPKAAAGESQLDRIERLLVALSGVGDDVIDRLDKLEQALGEHVDESVESVSQGVAGLANAFDQFVAAASPEDAPPPEGAEETSERPAEDRRVQSRRSTSSGPR